MENLSSSQQAKQPINQRVFTFISLILSAWFIGAVIYITLARISYPFDLEWMEGNSLIQLLRLMEGKALYVRPSMEYIPYIYPPFYYYLSFLAAKITGTTWFFPLRLVSLAASAGITLLIYHIVYKSTKSWYWGFIAGGFFAATFRIGGSWFDIARVDMLFIFLLLVATFFLQKNSWPAGLAAGGLFACALLTKQTAIFPTLCIMVYAILFLNRRSAILAGLTFIASAGAWIWLENARSGGWFWYYFFTLPRQHSMLNSEYAYLGQPIILVLPVIVASYIGFVGFFTTPRDVLKSPDGIWTAFALAMLATSVLASLNPGSYNNNYVPYYVGITIMFGINLPRLISRISGSHRLLKLVLLNAICVAQFFSLFYTLSDQIPTAADLLAGQELVARLKSVDGDVLAPNHNALPVLAGKEPFAHLITLQELRGNFGNPDSQNWDSVMAEINSMLENQSFGAVLLDQPTSIWVDVTKYYREEKIPYSSPNVFWPVTGGRTRPEYLYTR